ncbi:hypothetical protein GCM10023188_18600 [Pontibacter saemangeumensis]|uniref:HTH cro/C1-type domain-containing protein n=1 Tax=Pontibacter saemangeumensis TaxID=1084525 RepID=A0ABP8LK19_9BACT
MSYIGKNIKKIRTIKNLSQAAFAQLFNLARPSVGAYEEGRSEPKIDTLVQIAKHFGVSIDALLTKELTINELYRFDIFKQNYQKGDVLIKVAEPEVPVRLPGDVALVKASEVTAYAHQHNQAEYQQQLPRLELVVPTEKGHVRAFEVTGSEMAPTLPPESTVIATSMDTSQRENLVQGRVYVMVTRQDILIRRLLAVQEAHLLLVAEQPGIAANTVPIAQLQELWEVRGVYNTSLQQPLSLEERLSMLQQVVQNLNQRVEELAKRDS